MDSSNSHMSHAVDYQARPSLTLQKREPFWRVRGGLAVMCSCIVI